MNIKTFLVPLLLFFTYTISFSQEVHPIPKRIDASEFEISQKSYLNKAEKQNKTARVTTATEPPRKNNGYRNPQPKKRAISRKPETIKHRAKPNDEPELIALPLNR